MRNSLRRSTPTRSILALLASVAMLGVALPGRAVMIPGGGPPKKADCYSEFNVDGVSAATKPTTVTCTDGDPACDFDGLCNDTCTFHVSVCANQPGLTGCTPPSALSSLSEKGKASKRIGLTAPALNGSACGAFANATVAVIVKHSGKKKPGTRLLHVLAVAASGKPKHDADKLTLVCQPRTGACPPHACTPIGVQGSCLAGQVCGADSNCAPTSACACGASTPTKLQYITAAGTGNCGVAKDSGGATVLDLGCGDLYFGSGAVATALPAVIPDLGKSIANVSACNGTLLGLAATTQTDTGSLTTCTSKNCYFGAPLPVPNPMNSTVSTCILNIISKDATGYAVCDSGQVTLNLPLGSELHLTGDLDGDPNNGIQPCPLCTGTPGAETCKFGDNDGGRCTPGTSALGSAYPTSQDCPPGGLLLGALPIAFSLSTATSQITASAVNSSQANAFCGYCYDNDDGTGSYDNPPVACKTGADCNGVTGPDPTDSNVPPRTITFEYCKQGNGLASGCFNEPTCTTISENGVAAGSLTDHAAHNVTLQSLFCIPPSFAPIVDGAADLPGPGATAIPGTVQVLP